MFRKINLVSATFVLMTILFTCALANAQPQSTTKSNTKDLAVPGTTTGKGWDGKVDGMLLVTPVTVVFDNPQDYDNFAAGRLRLNLILKNMVSGQTIRPDSKQLTEGFRPGRDKSRLTINVIVDNMSAPLSEAACGVISPSAENTSDGVNITLSYSGCDSSPAQRPGGPIGNIIVKGGSNGGSQRTSGNPVIGVIVKGGKNPGGNLNIVTGDSRVMMREAAGQTSNAMGVIPAVSSKGNGSNKAQNF